MVNSLSPITQLPLGTGLLAFRDLKEICKEYVYGKKALDFGCGAGRSTHILSDLGFEVTGVDKDQYAIDLARTLDTKNQYHLASTYFNMESQEKFDLIFLAFVLMECGTKEEMFGILKQLKKHMALDAKIIVITCTHALYQNQWVSIRTNFIENRSLRSGAKAKLYLVDYDTYIHDYFWTHHDYMSVFLASELKPEAHFLPLGRPEDKKPWVSEWTIAPFEIFILSNAHAAS